MGIWIRIHYPYLHVDDVIEFMAEKKFSPILDISFQYASPTVLCNVKRPTLMEK
ncbi:ribosomal protein S12 methylthiotransferase RimO [Bartonella quintana JK 12]|uniref:Ribosomal protein S12 methylthiotransferase RimO n=2 Tax=Bartonella quintana TaxID=803 RepID=W3TXB3_BARQI|nr:ribosomal protein S12 methylthiotransferase RimO [Bartonella quintana BQ2-D70]ETS14304.1 ribosomal protein S12 methylthiotransferase RimO [Bartonella quintana JK 73rel]ETS15991.1 ribosomal protein S12 methylthiotransferase RimO [Bartonella quintana JK 73]ETS17994.1 ribosomal protein S12 methylthiotransferase RimO [Bartonella quintana JK 7]ETS18823.1 ribosomal protein S12 methylthiotransferase RimO [Bartonella quintana JK 12]KEC60189.1 ribosomal protein S12 methylthiotransferase RimO [Barton